MGTVTTAVVILNALLSAQLATKFVTMLAELIVTPTASLARIRVPDLSVGTTPSAPMVIYAW